MPGFPFSIDAIAGTLLGKALGNTTTRDPFGQSILQWASHVAQAGGARWGAVARSGVGCGLRVAAPEGPRACGTTAVAGCAACRVPTCLGHAAVCANGDVICLACVNRVLGGARVPVQPQPIDVEAERRRCLAVLGFKKTNPSWKKIAVKYKMKLAENHPDRDPSPEAKERYLQIRAAYDRLVQLGEDRKAAA